MAKDARGWVYFIRATGLGLAKIGFSRSHPDRRYRQLCSACPVSLEPIAFMIATRSVEAELHDRFRANWSHGEWFAEDAVMTDYIASLSLEPWRVAPLQFSRNLSRPVVPVQGEVEWADTSMIGVDGELRSLTEWAEICGYTVREMRMRFRAGATMDEIAREVAMHVRNRRLSGTGGRKRRSNI